MISAKHIGAALLVLWLQAPVWAAVSFDTFSACATTSSSTSLTCSHTVGGSCSNAVLYSFVAHDTASDQVSGATYNGVAMTRLTPQLNLNASCYLYRLIAPAIGAAHNVVVTATSEQFAVVSISVCGAHQTTPERDSDGDTTNGATWSLPAVDSATTDYVLAALCQQSEAVVGTDWTVPVNEVADIQTGASGVQLTAAHGAGTAGTVTASGTKDSGTNVPGIVVSVQQAAVAATRRSSTTITQ